MVGFWEKRQQNNKSSYAIKIRVHWVTVTLYSLIH